MLIMIAYLTAWVIGLPIAASIDNFRGKDL